MGHGARVPATCSFISNSRPQETWNVIDLVIIAVSLSELLQVSGLSTDWACNSVHTQTLITSDSSDSGLSVFRLVRVFRVGGNCLLLYMPPVLLGGLPWDRLFSLMSKMGISWALTAFLSGTGGATDRHPPEVEHASAGDHKLEGGLNGTERLSEW